MTEEIKNEQGKTIKGGNLSIGNKISDETLYSTAVGIDALDSLTTGQKNTAVGKYTMAETTTGEKNSAYGYKTMWKNQSGNNNAGYGYETLQENTGSNNVAVGKEALADSVNNNDCVAIGYKAGYHPHASLPTATLSEQVFSCKVS
jgi:hypothetical protein